MCIANLSHTAYGAKVRVPGNVDILIAGTSCVDYSQLNRNKKTIDAKGESGRTFQGMLKWVNKHRPPLVVLENICTCPWEKVCNFFREKGYSAQWCRFDTKNYYIPHTRTRGYCFAIDQKNSSKRPFTQWKEDGTCLLPDFAWADWASGQVDRVLDLLDISLLKSAQKGIDQTYKTCNLRLSVLTTDKY